MSSLSRVSLVTLMFTAPGCADDVGPVPADDASESSTADDDGVPEQPTTGSPADDSAVTGPPPATADGSSAADTATSTDDGTTDGDSSGTDKGSSTDAGSTDTDSTDTSSTDAGSTDAGSTDGGSTDGGSTDSGSTDDGKAGSTDDGKAEASGDGTVSLDAFETPQPFGDSVTELDLIGTWNLPTNGGSPGYNMTLTIDAAGRFDLVERDNDCNDIHRSDGTLWVNTPRLVMLFESSTASAPWDVPGHFGWDATPPFLLRTSYAPVLGHVALTAPADFRVTLPWGSRGYARTVGGTTAQDVWVAESELWAVAPGNSAATIVARDRWRLDVAGGSDTWLVISHWWFQDGIQTADPTEYYLLPYTDDLVGHFTLAGANYVYVGNAMASYAPGDNFQKNAPSACP